jgi:hypothetical protein
MRLWTGSDDRRMADLQVEIIEVSNRVNALELRLQQILGRLELLSFHVGRPFSVSRED